MKTSRPVRRLCQRCWATVDQGGEKGLDSGYNVELNAVVNLG